MDKYAIPEHTMTEDYPIRWEGSWSGRQLVVKEVICIRTLPESLHFNCDGDGG